MPRTYFCGRCGRRYTIREYEEDRFCRNCGTYLMPGKRVSKRSSVGKALEEAERPKVGERSWLPEGYEVREGQVEFIEEASKALESREVFFGSAPCGVGKSLASLLAVLPRLGDEKLLVCFRTRSQLHIYLKELRAIGRGLSATSFISKRDMCPRMKTGISYYDFLEECRRLRANCGTQTRPYCEFYMKNTRRTMEAEKLALECARRILPPMKVVKLMAKHGFCAYEAMKSVLGKVDIFLGTYHYAFDPMIRTTILKSLDVDLSKVYLIVDEAHNLPGFSRELLSDQLTRRTVEEALRETEAFEHEAFPYVVKCLETLNEDVFDRLRDGLEREELRRVDPQGLSDIFMERCDVSGIEAAEALHDYGEDVRETRRELGYERIYSYNHRVGEFLTNFFAKQPERHLHLAQKDRRERIILEVRCFDGRELTDPVLREGRGSILMSGFLSPLEVYRDLTLHGGEATHSREFDSPFPSENRLILAAKDVSSRYEERTGETLQRLRGYIEATLEANRGNVAVFSTSYKLMHRILKEIDTERNLIVERPRTSRDTVLKQLRGSDSNALYGVMGGKFSEGVDYPGDLLTCVLAVGLPYATWDVYQRGLISYYNHQYPGQGRAYAYVTPAILRLIQACGRVHRSATDKGCIVILDKRVTHPKIRRLLPTYFQREMKTVEDPMETAEWIESFWTRHID